MPLPGDAIQLEMSFETEKLKEISMLLLLFQLIIIRTSSVLIYSLISVKHTEKGIEECKEIQ
jgi:hypothetical protein